MLRYVWLLGLLGLLAACSPPHPGVSSESPQDRSEEQLDAQPTPQMVTEIVRANLEDYGPAPELENEVWLNTEQPLRLADLHGKVVLIDMWTYG